MHRRTACLGILSLIAACSAGQPPEPALLSLHCGQLIDGIADSPLDNQRVRVDGERIVSVSNFNPEEFGNDQLLDFSDSTCLPGLIDTHVHLALLAEDSSDMTIYYRRPRAETLAIGLENSALTVRAGFTTVRNVGDYFPDVVLELKLREQRGEEYIPRVQTAGPYLTIPAGGGDLVIPDQPEADIPAAARLGVARGAEDFAARTVDALDAGADMIKVIASGAVFAYGGVPGAPEMTPEEIRAVVNVASVRGAKVTAHAHGAQSIKDAINAGVDSIEHASLADDEAIALAAERGVAFSMDVYNGTYTAEVGLAKGYPEEFMRKNDETTEAQRQVFEKALAAGVPILYGTDAGVYPHGLNARQFEVMVARGMTPMQAIQSATSVAARHMGWAGDVGAIVAGRYADIAIVQRDPLVDIGALQTIEAVIKGGKAIAIP